MSRVFRPVRGALLALGALAALGALSQAPYASTEASHALLRLAWRVRGTPVHECRRLSPEELERLPVHMRRAEDCEPRVLSYRLEVRIDGRVETEQLVQAAGARGDRPVYVHRELILSPGEHLVEIAFVREPQHEEEIEHEAEETAEEESREHRDDERQGPARLALHARLSLGAGEVALITYDPEQRSLVLRGRGPADARP